MNRRGFLGGLASVLAVRLGVRPAVAPAVAAPVVAPAAATGLVWSQESWAAAHAFFQAYRLNMVLGSRLDLFEDDGSVLADPFPFEPDGTNVLADPFPFEEWDHVWAERLQRRSRGRLGTHEARQVAARLAQEA